MLTEFFDFIRFSHHLVLLCMVSLTQVVQLLEVLGWCSSCGGFCWIRSRLLLSAVDGFFTLLSAALCHVCGVQGAQMSDEACRIGA